MVGGGKYKPLKTNVLQGFIKVVSRQGLEPWTL
jgi:hypothetical protein